MSNYTKTDFGDRKVELNSNYGFGYAITPNDGSILSPPTRGIYVGATGDLTVTLWGMENTQTLLFKAVPVGTLLPIRAKKVWATGTGASQLIGLL